MATTDNYSTIVNDTSSKALRYISKNHIFQNWTSDTIDPSLPLDNVLSNTNYFSAMSIVNSNVNVFGDITVYGAINSIGGSPFLAAADVLSGIYVANASIINIIQDPLGNYTVSCSAVANISGLSWVLRDNTSIIASGSGGTVYTFSNVRFTTGKSVSLSAYASGGTLTARSSACNFTAYTAYVNVTTPPTILTPIYTSIDNVNYYTTGTTFQFPVAAFTFCNLTTVPSYTGSNFFTINSNSYSWNTVFGTSNPGPSNAYVIPSPAQQVVSCNIVITATNSSSSIPSTSVTKILYVPSNISPVIPNTNPVISSISRIYTSNNTTLGSNDMIYAPLQNSFASDLSYVISGFLSPASQSNVITGRHRVYMSITPASNIPIVSFGVVHNSSVNNIYVSWSNLGSNTFYSASNRYTVDGCGAGSNISTWYIRRPTSLSQVFVSPVTLYIDYNANVVPVPSII